MAGLVCPKCGSEMRSYERNGITVDQCTGCRGLFLDRGNKQHHGTPDERQAALRTGYDEGRPSACERYVPPV